MIESQRSEEGSIGRNRKGEEIKVKLLEHSEPWKVKIEFITGCVVWRKTALRYLREI